MAEFVEKFPLLLSPEEEKILCGWLRTCGKVWNVALSALQELDQSTSINRVFNGKPERVAYPSCPFAVSGEGTPRPVRTGWFKNEIKGEGEVMTVWAEHCWILPKGRKGGTVDLFTGEPTHAIAPNLIRVGQSCPMPIPEWREPRLGIQVPGKYSLQYFLTQANVRLQYPYLAEEFEEVPAWFIRGLLDSLWQAWSRYKSGLAGEPRFKRPSDPVTSLTYADASKLVLSFDKENPKNGTISIPKLGRKISRDGKERPAPAVLKVVDLGRRFTVDTSEGKVLRTPSVARIVQLPNGRWQLHLTAFEPTTGEIQSLAKLLAASTCGTLTPSAQLYILLDSWWRYKRNKDCTLIVPGKDYVVAVDDRGRNYTVLPRRHTDGAIDPHGLIPDLNRRIEELQRRISWKRECSKRYGTPVESNALKKLKCQLRRLWALRTSILRANRQKIAHFISASSRDLTIHHGATTRMRKPRPRLKPGSDPAEYQPNGAEVIAGVNRVAADSAPGEFVALIKRYAAEHGQNLSIKESKKGSKGSKKSKRK